MQRTYREPPGRAEVIRRVDRREHRCVRCGLGPPAPELFICAACQADPETMIEVHNVEEDFVDPADQRKVLRTFGWRGGWWR